MSVRNYAILYGGKSKSSVATTAGGNALLDTGTHAFVGPEHTGEEITSIPTTETDATLVLAPDGAGGVEFRTEAGGALPEFSVLDHGLVGDNVTDDTAALLALYDFASASGTRSCRVVWPAPPVKYLIAGALLDTSGFNAQVPMPTVPFTSGQITIENVGAMPAPTFGTATTSTPVPTGDQGYSVIRSSLTGASGTAACFGAGVHSGSPPYVNNIIVSFRNLIFEGPTNPTFTMVNLRGSIGSPEAFVDCMMFTTGWPAGGTRGTHTNAYGARLGQYGGTNWQYVRGLLVVGWYTGLEQGELADVSGFRAALCHTAVELPASMHPSTIRQMEQTACTIGIDVTGSHYCDIQLYDAEHYTAGDATTYDLNDPSNYLHGGGQWVGIAIGGTNDHTFNINGGTNSHWNELGTLPSAAPSGTAGGDLSGTYPNPTVAKLNGIAVTGTPSVGQVPTATGTTAATWQTPSAGSGQHILLADGHATPFAFTDLLQMDDGSDFMWSDS